MSLTTQCPRCSTAFHVTPEQLREAQGWVRCGICQEVFGAQAHAMAEESLALDEAPPALRQASASHSDVVVTSSTATPASKVRPPSASKWGKSWIDWFVFAGVVLLFLMQIVWQQRHNIAMQFPIAATWLQSICVTDICSFRNIANISIADSSFSAPDPSHFKLSAEVTNRSTNALEAPSLALVLTDSADRVIARKLYGPLQWGASASTMPAQTTWPMVLWIQFDPPADSPPVVGYRLKAFYP